MAPEIFINTNYNAKYGPEVDLWALGVMTYLMLTGCFAFVYSQEHLNNLFRTTRFELPANFTPEARHFVSKLMTTKPVDRMTFKELEFHPFLTNAIDVVVAIPHHPGSAEPPIFQTVTIPSSNLPSFTNARSLVQWNGIANYVHRTLVTWGFSVPPSAGGQDVPLMAFTIPDGKWVDLKSGTSSPDDLRKNRFRVLMLYTACESGALTDTHCAPSPADRTPVNALLDVTSRSSSNNAGADVNACRAAATRCADFVKRLYNAYQFAATQCTFARDSIALLERTCAEYADLLGKKLYNAAATLERLKGGAGLLYTLVPKDTAESGNFDNRGYDAVKRVMSTETFFRNYAAFNDEYARYNVGKLREGTEYLMKALPAFDVELAAIMDTFTAYWNTMVRELVAIKAFSMLGRIAGDIAVAKDPETAGRLVGEYSAKLSEVMALFPSWAVRLCSNGSAGNLAGNGAGGGGMAGVQTLPSDAVMREEYDKKIRALKEEKRRLLEENKRLLEESKQKNKNIIKIPLANDVNGGTINFKSGEK